MIKENGRMAARVLSAVSRDGKSGCFSMFEASSPAAGRAAIEVAMTFQRKHGSARITGPLPPSALDYGRGILCAGFERRPPVMDVYNSDWYPKVMGDCGFTAVKRWLSFAIPLDSPSVARYRRVGEWAAARYSLRAEAYLRDPRRVCGALREVECEDSPDGFRGSEGYAKAWSRLRKACPGVRFSAVLSGGRAVGYAVTLPDGTDRARLATVAVAPDFRNRGAAVALLAALIEALERDGVRTLDASLIDSENRASRRLAERAGGVITHQYREYSRKI